MRNLPNKLVFEADGKLSVRVPGKWRREVSQLTRNEYMAIPYEAKEKILFAEFQTGKRIDTGYPVIVSRHCSVLGSRLKC